MEMFESWKSEEKRQWYILTIEAKWLAENTSLLMADIQRIQDHLEPLQERLKFLSISALCLHRKMSDELFKVSEKSE